MNKLIQPLAISMAVSACFATSCALAQSDSFSPDVVITANRQVQLAKDVLADNVVITADQIQKTGATTIVDLLQQQRGIEISRTGGAGNVSSVFIRGAANAQSVVFVDGVRVGSSTFGGATWSSIPLSQIERIEIIYGPVSSIYGADAIGGVIQLFTKKSSASSRTNISVGLGSKRLRKTEFGVFGSDRGDFQYALNAARESSNGFSASKEAAGAYTYNPDKDGYTQKSFNGKLAWKLQNNWKVGVDFVQSTLDVDFDAGKTYRDRSHQKFDSVATYFAGKIQENWNSRLQFSRSHDRAASDASYGKSFANTANRGWTWQNDVNFGRDVFQFVVENREEDVVTDQPEVTGKRDTTSYALGYILKQDAHLFSANARIDDSSQYDRHQTGSVAYGYKISDNLRVNVSQGTSFRAPTFNELYYPGYGVTSIKPETGKNREFGFYYDDNTLQMSAVSYKNEVSNLIAYAYPCPVEVSTHSYGCAYNVAKAILSGTTFGASLKLDQFSLRGSIDIQDPRDAKTGNSLARRAKKHATAGIDYRMQDMVVGVEAVFSGERFDDTSNLSRLGGYGIVNLVVTHKLSGSWSGLFRWNNIGNKDYELAKNYRTPGSNVYLGLNYGFK